MHWTTIEEHDDTSTGVVALRLRGQMTLDKDEKALLDVVKPLVAAGRRHLVLNLEHVAFVDSVGLGEIVRTHSTMARAGGALRLCGVAPRIQAVLDATQLSRVLVTFPTEREAIASFGASTTSL